MKNPFYFFVAMIILFSSCKKTNHSTTPATPEPTKEIINSLISGSDCLHFARLFKGYKMENIQSVKQTKDGGYIFCGSTETIAASESDILIIKTDCFGKTEWMRTFSNSYSDFGYDITPLSSGGYFITANFSIDPSYWKIIRHKGQFILLDSAGTFLSKQDCTAGSATYLRKTIETTDGIFLTCGHDENNGNFILKTDLRGNQYWVKYFGNAGLSDIALHNNNYLACGSTIINNKEAIYLAEMDEDGDTLWTKSIDKNIKGSASSIAILNNNEIAIGGTYRTSNTTFAGFVMRLDATGKEIWYRSLEAEDLQSLVDISGTINNDIVTVVNRPAGGLNMIKLNFDTGSIIWNVNKPSNSSIQDFQLTVDEGFIAVGRSFEPGGNLEGYVLKTDKNGD